MDLVLGTVQFGMDYGIRGQKRPTLEQSIEMLDYATQNGISHIDTANAYGMAEDVVGCFLLKKTIARDQLFLISKLKPNVLDLVEESQYYEVIRRNLEESLQKLGTDYLDSYLLHSARYIFDDAIIFALERVKRDGLTKQIGVSVYEPAEAKKGLEREQIDLIQLPFSIFDQRMKSSGFFDHAMHKLRKKIHSRSAFIQGLILMNEAELPPFLQKAIPIVKKIKTICKTNGVSRIALALHFVKHQSGISHLVFGVDCLEQLQENIRLFNDSFPIQLLEELAEEFSGLEPDIVMPSLWNKSEVK